MKRVVGIAAVILAVVIIIVVAKTLAYDSKQVEVEKVEGIELDRDALASRLGEAITYRTISSQDPEDVDFSTFEAFHSFLERTFPLVHSRLEKEVVADHSLVYTWLGKDKSKKPIVLMAHMDVVPIASGTMDDWTHPPFSGAVEDGFIWGRGTLDDKGSLMAILEAVEALLASDYQPERTVLLTFGHDEEVGGSRGQARIVEKFVERGVKAFFVLDESGAITEGVVPGIEEPVALIGIAEKGYASLVLTATDEGGHSSMPPVHSAIGILAEAITKLEGNQFPTVMSGPAMEMFEYVGPELPFAMRLVFANRWLFSPVIEGQLLAQRSTAASIRTTTAVTMIDAGDKENVLPQKAEAVVNFRLLPSTSIEDLMEHVKTTIDDERVTVSYTSHEPHEASKVSDPGSEGYAVVEKSIRELFPGVIVAPYLVLGGTDAKHYGPVSDTILRFLPTRMDPDDLKRPHGTNERIGVDNYKEVVQFYARVIQNAD